MPIHRHYQRPAVANGIAVACLLHEATASVGHDPPVFRNLDRAVIPRSTEETIMLSSTIVPKPCDLSGSYNFADCCKGLAMALPGVDYIGEDDDAAVVADSIGISAADCVLLDARVGGRPVTLMCISSATWHQSDEMVWVLELKRILEGEGKKAVLVPERFVRRQPRLRNALSLAEAGSCAIRAGDRMRVLSHLIEYGDATLVELAALVSAPDPVSAIFGLIVDGCLEMNLNAPIMPNSMIRIAEPKLL